MADANNGRISEVLKLRALARQFRAKAGETQLAVYIDMMGRSAMELERLADKIEAEGQGKGACSIYA